MAGTTASAHTRLVPRLRADTRAKTEPRLAAGTPDPDRLDSTSPYPRSFEPEGEGRESLPYLEVEIQTEPQYTLAAHLDVGTTAKRSLRVVKTVARKLGVGTGTESALPAAPPLAASKAVDPAAPTAKLEAGAADADAHATGAGENQDPSEFGELPTTTIEKQRASETDEVATAAIERPTQSDDGDDERATGALLVRKAAEVDELELSTARVVKMLEGLVTPPSTTRAITANAAPASAARAAAARAAAAGAEAAVTAAPLEPGPRPSSMSWLGVVLAPPEVGAQLVIGTWLRPEFCVTSQVTHVLPRDNGTLVETITKSRYFIGIDGDTYRVRGSG